MSDPIQDAADIATGRRIRKVYTKAVAIADGDGVPQGNLNNFISAGGPFQSDADKAATLAATAVPPGTWATILAELMQDLPELMAMCGTVPPAGK